MNYSKKLIDRCIKYFKENKGVVLSEEEAAQGLDDLAALFLAFAKKDELPKNTDYYCDAENGRILKCVK